eukprot:14952701-Alexandrium_andersonii.AAC.1
MSHWHGIGVASTRMLVWPEEEHRSREVRLRKEAREIRRARWITAKQGLLCQVQKQRQTMGYLQQKVQYWEE